MMLFFLEFLLIGLGIGFLGTLVGAGGGFILTPLLLLWFPDRPSEAIAALSLSVVTLNALSGSIAYYRLGRIDLKTSLVYGLAALPWVFLGAFSTSRVARGPFDVILGLALLGLCVSLLWPSAPEPPRRTGEDNPSLVPRRIVDRSGRVFEYRFRYKQGIWLSVAVGFLSSFMGIGGGPIYVPLMIRVLRVPPHIATATSQCLLLITVFAAALIHLLAGHLAGMGGLILPLALGMVAGAQAGAAISGRVRSAVLTRILAALLVLVSLQVLYRGAVALLP
ncbi:MAG: sulfite exporter TauE/SafE family protein [Nitrospinota bacterium]